MSHLKPMALAMSIAFASLPQAHANPSRELAEIKAQLQEMRKTYEQRITALEKKLADAEATATRAEDAAKAATQSSTQLAVRPTPAEQGNRFNPEVSLILQGQYKKAKDVSERGITGFMPADSHSHSGISDNNRRGYSIDHTELVLAANVDTQFRAQAIFAIKDGETEVEESWFQSLGLGHGLGLKGGRYRSGIGYLNEQHPHQWDFADAPLMYQALFGYHGSYTQDGVQFKWLAPTDTFLELGLETGRGKAFPGTERNRNGSGAAAIFAHLGGDLGLSNQWRAGLSYLHTAAKDREAHFMDSNNVEALTKFTGKSNMVMADFIWKWAPNGNSNYENFKLQGEYFRRQEDGNLNCEDADAAKPTTCTGGVLSNHTSRQTGWYAQAVYQFTPHWRTGIRFDRLNSGSRDFGINGGNLILTDYKPRRNTAMVDYTWSEFSRMRLQFAQDKSMTGVTDNQLVLQYIMSLGAHGAHKF